MRDPFTVYMRARARARLRWAALGALVLLFLVSQGVHELGGLPAVGRDARRILEVATAVLLTVCVAAAALVASQIVRGHWHPFHHPKERRDA